MMKELFLILIITTDKEVCMKTIELAIIGAGPAGLAAAYAAQSLEITPHIFEKNNRIGAKLELTGGGRCNVTNNKMLHDLIPNYPENGKFLLSTLSSYGPQDIISFFESHHLRLKEENNGRMFPISNKSHDVIAVFTRALKNTKIHLQTEVLEIDFVQNMLFTREDSYHFKALILATGGVTYQKTGSTGFGHKILKQNGVHVTQLYPSEVPLTLEHLPKQLQGISLTQCELSIYRAHQHKKPLFRVCDDLIFTHFGISGPGVLKCSQFYVREHRKQHETRCLLDVIPEYTVNELRTLLHTNRERYARSLFGSRIPKRFLKYIEDIYNLTEKKIKQYTPSEQEQFIQALKSFNLSIRGTLPMQRAFITGGGVDISEVYPKSMELRKFPSIFVVGELLDINGFTGGYNITAALSTGHTAGTCAAQYILESRAF